MDQNRSPELIWTRWKTSDVDVHRPEFVWNLVWDLWSGASQHRRGHPLRLGGLRHRQGQRIFHPSKSGRRPKGGKGGARVLWWRYWGSLGALDDAQWCLKIEDFLPKLSILVGTSYDKTQFFFFGGGIFRQTHRLDGEFRPRKHMRW